MEHKQSNNDLVKALKQKSAHSLALIRNELLKYRFLLNAHNSKKLAKSLAHTDQQHLSDTTLLSPKTHKIHAEKLATRYKTHWAKLKKNALKNWQEIPSDLRHGTPNPSDFQIASQHLRFFTLVDSVSLIDANAALRAAARMKAELVEAIANRSGVWCLGSVEAEIISISMMRKIALKTDGTDSERRKLDVCEKLALELEDTLFADEESLFLVHFHGLLSAKRESDFQKLRSVLNTNPRWSKAGRQIEIKKLSEEFQGKPKSVEKNLEHIATYITKGGNDWYAGKAYLRYKIHFNLPDDQVSDETTWIAKNWRTNEVLRAEHKEDGITDVLSLNVTEIAELANFIDKMMQINKTRTGYLIQAGS